MEHVSPCFGRRIETFLCSVFLMKEHLRNELSRILDCEKRYDEGRHLHPTV